MTDSAIERVKARVRLGVAIILMALIVGTFAADFIHARMAVLISALRGG